MVGGASDGLFTGGAGGRGRGGEMCSKYLNGEHDHRVSGVGTKMLVRHTPAV